LSGRHGGSIVEVIQKLNGQAAANGAANVRGIMVDVRLIAAVAGRPDYRPQDLRAVA
jgi:hypothetical protein